MRHSAVNLIPQPRHATYFKKYAAMRIAELALFCARVFFALRSSVQGSLKLFTFAARRVINMQALSMNVSGFFQVQFNFDVCSMIVSFE